MSRARRALGQRQHATAPIETVRGRGYRFVEVVHLRKVLPKTAEAPAGDVDTDASIDARDPFVGRGPQMARLVAALERARHKKRGGLVLVAGDPGTGKTRLLREFADRARADGVTVWRGRCLEGGRTTPFWPWVQILRESAKDPLLRDEALSLIDALVPDGASSSSGIHPSRYWLMEKVCQHLLELPGGTTRLVVIDDVHWADDASLDLAALLSKEVEQSSLLVVVTADDSLSPPVGSPRASVRIGPTELLQLSPLGFADVERYASLILGHELPRDVCQVVQARSGGNPLLLQETLRLLVEQSGRSAATAESVRVPTSAREILRSRLEGLDARVCEAVEAASVLGEEFQLGLLRRLVGGPLGELVAKLEAAIGTRLLAPCSNPGSYRFVHGALHQAIYEQLPNSRRLDLHLGAAEAIEAEGESGELAVRELALHLYRALPRSDPARVEACAATAADSAMKRLAYEEAAELYEWALHALTLRENATHRERCELLIKLAHGLRRGGKIFAAEERASEAMALAKLHGSAELLLSASRCLRGRVSQNASPDPLVLGALEEALRLTPREQPGLRAGILAQLACIPPHSLDVRSSQGMGREAEELARQTGDPKVLLDALLGRLATLSGPDNVGLVVDVSQEILQGHLGPSDSERYEVVLARFYAYSLKPARDRRDFSLSELGRLARRLGQEERTWHVRRFMAAISLNEGRFDAAKAAYDELHTDAQRLKLPYGNFHRTAFLLEWARARTGQPFLDIGANLLSEWHWAAPQPAFQANRAPLFLAAGMVSEARVVFESIAANGFEDLPRELSYLNALACMSETAIGLGDAPRAELLYSLQRPFEGYCTLNRLGFHRGPVALHLGRLADFLGRQNDAVDHLESSLALSSHMGWLPDVVRSQVALARALDNGSPMKGRRARKLLTEALATARRLGMEPVAAEIEQMRSAEGRRGSARSLRPASGC
jgi:tetratricopeptide (TPR) repeat protein